jgi:hypothetical protein
MTPRKTVKLDTLEPVISQTREKLASTAAIFSPYTSIYGAGFPWTDKDVDNFEIEDVDNYRKVVALCRFFYKHDPIASTVINKLIDIGITPLQFYKGTLSENDYKVFKGIKEDLQEFLEDCALEYLTTGLLIPEIAYTTVGSPEIRELGIKKTSALTLPTDMWVRDAGTIKINSSYFSSKDSYYAEVPDEVIFFIQNKGQYPDGTKDIDLYNQLASQYPVFVTLVLKGEKYIKLEDPIIFRRRKLSNGKYPIPFLYPALEILKHKRNIRKMDYSIASRVISAIQLVQLGDKDFPLLADDQKQLDELKTQMLWRDGTGRNQERIYQLFGNHTLQISWVYPPTDVLLNDAKYKDINQEILFALGFPRILLSGEVEKTGTSDPEYALLSPVKTMENLQRKLLQLVNEIVEKVCKFNGIKGRPETLFQPINLHDFLKLLEALMKLYDGGNISRTTIDSVLGYNIETEFENRKKENALLTEYGLEGFAPTPHSNAPEVGGGDKAKPTATPKKSANPPSKASEEVEE